MNVSVLADIVEKQVVAAVGGHQALAAEKGAKCQGKESGGKLSWLLKLHVCHWNWFFLAWASLYQLSSLCRRLTGSKLCILWSGSFLWKPFLVVRALDLSIQSLVSQYCPIPMPLRYWVEQVGRFSLRYFHPFIASHPLSPLSEWLQNIS